MKQFVQKQGFMNCIRMMALLFALSIELVLGNNLYGQTKAIPIDDVVKVTFEENFVPSSGNPLKLPMLQKEERLKAKATKIEPTILTDNEQVEKCFNYAISVWENQILNGVPIYIELREEPIDCDIRTDVYYRSNLNGTYWSLALDAYKNKYTIRDHNTPDGIITINCNTNWDYSIGDNILSDCNNLTFALMRGIAKILGFGSSVNITSDGSFKFQCKRGYTVFDQLISNSEGVKLTSIELINGQPNSSLKDYINTKTNGFILTTPKKTYELAPPPYNNSNPPLSLLKDENSLMRSNMRNGSYALRIDDSTAEILNHLGWGISLRSPFTIVSDELGESGIGSAYSDHVFRVNYFGIKPKNPRWELTLTLSDGTKETTNLPDNNLSCTVPAIKDESRYKISQDGDIEGKLRFCYLNNGKEVYTNDYRMYLELKPYIEYAKIEKVEDNYPEKSYNIHYKVKYRGSNRISVAVEEEYSSILKTDDVFEPYICTGNVNHISSRYNAWIDFIAENKYGKSIYTIEMKPNGIIGNGSITASTSRNLDNASIIESYDYIEIFDINGIKINNSENIIQLNELKGFYIIKCFKNGTLAKNIKYFGR